MIRWTRISFCRSNGTYGDDNRLRTAGCTPWALLSYCFRKSAQEPLLRPSWTIMWAVLPGAAAVQYIDTDHVRHYVAMAEKFLDHAVIVAPANGCVTNIWPRWVKKDIRLEWSLPPSAPVKSSPTPGARSRRTVHQWEVSQNHCVLRFG